VTRREETVANTDGTTTTTTISSNGDTVDARHRQLNSRQAIRANNAISGQIRNEGASQSIPSVLVATESSDSKTTSRPREYKIDSNQHLEKNHSGLRPPAMHPAIPWEETHIIDLIDDDLTLWDVSIGNGSGSDRPPEISKAHKKNEGASKPSEEKINIVKKESETETKSGHRGYKTESKQHLRQNFSGIYPSAMHPAMPRDETYVIDLTEDDGTLVNLSVHEESIINHPPKSSNAQGKNEEVSNPNEDNPKATMKNIGSDAPNIVPRKGKLHPCLRCCFPEPENHLQHTSGG